jgi:hypothetical protein
VFACPPWAPPFFFFSKAILSDPVVRQVIQDLSTNDPKSQAAGNKAMRDPVMGAKINKLIAAGVLQTG